MKKILPLLTVAVVFLALAACDKKQSEDPPHSGGYTTISGVIQNMPTDAVEYVLKAIVKGEGEDLIVAECDVAANGSFSLSLPKTVSSAYLQGMGNEFNQPGIVISDTNAKIGQLNIELYGDDVYVDNIMYASYNFSPSLMQITAAMPAYSASAFTVAGSVNAQEGDVSVNLLFVTGWNWMVVRLGGTTSLENLTYTSKLPGGMQWFLGKDLPLK